MARTLDKFPPATGTARYPWDEWLNGQVWELRAGEDYTGKAPTIRQMAREQAKRRDGTVRTRLFANREDGDERIILQFHRR